MNASTSARSSALLAPAARNPAAAVCASASARLRSPRVAMSAWARLKQAPRSHAHVHTTQDQLELAGGARTRRSIKVRDVPCRVIEPVPGTLVQHNHHQNTSVVNSGGISSGASPSEPTYG